MLVLSQKEVVKPMVGVQELGGPMQTILLGKNENLSRLIVLKLLLLLRSR
jgi:hypothetical protein